MFAFEPSNSNFKILNENIRINKYSDMVVTINKAVSNKEEQVTLYLNDENHGMNRIFKSNAYTPKINHMERIETIRLDSFFDKVPSLKVDFVKLDIEGSEYGAIKGMQKIVDNNKKLTLMTEFHPASITEYGIEPRQFLELLYSFGFNIWSLDKTTKNKKRIALSSKNEVDDLIKLADKQTTNLLCSR